MSETQILDNDMSVVDVGDEIPVFAEEFDGIAAEMNHSARSKGRSTVSFSAGDPAQFLAELDEHFDERGTGPASQNYILSCVTSKYLAWIDPEHAPGSERLEQELLAATNQVVRNENQKLPKGDPKLPLATKLTAWQVAQVLLRLHHVIRIAPNAADTDREYDLLAMYETTGRGRGTYTASEEDIRTAARLYNTSLTLNEYKEVVAVLREGAQRTHQSTHRDLIAVNNGIAFYGAEDQTLTIRGKEFHFKAKQVHPFDPAIVFLSKAHIDYDPDAQNPAIMNPDGTEWDVVSWIEELFDEPGQEGLADLIWEIIGAVIRPHVRWGKAAWFYSEAGNNGKGTLCALMRNLVGAGAHTSIPLSDFGKDFALEPLMTVNGIIVDENDVGTFIDKAANLKAIVTNDVIQINRKHRMPIAFQFWGFMVQCFNEFPRMKDKSESFYRRQLFVPFSKSYTGRERRYIKDDYLQRQEVLEYVLWYVINRAGAATPGNYYELSEPLATREVLAEYKEVNDPVRAYWEEFREQFVWDLLPFPFLYDHYRSWMSKVSPSGSPVSNTAFIGDLVSIVREDPEWYTKENKRQQIRPTTMMDASEPLIGEYKLSDWYSPTYTGSDPFKLGRPDIKPNYRGVLRKHLTSVPAHAQAAEAHEDVK